MTSRVEREAEKGINEIVGTFSDPIIVTPGGWGNDLPQWLKDAVTMERLIENMEGFRRGAMTGTDAEAVCYMFTACLAASLGHDWTEIYLYVATKVIERHKAGEEGFKLPPDIRVVELNRYQQGLLAHLKAWIYDRRVKNRKGRNNGKAEGNGDRKEKVPAAENPQLTFNLQS